MYPLVISGVLNVTLRFPRTKVPAKGTTYICFNFELPDDQEYHLIATQPVIDNENVMHHMTITSCDSTGQYEARLFQPRLTACKTITLTFCSSRVDSCLPLMCLFLLLYVYMCVCSFVVLSKAIYYAENVCTRKASTLLTTCVFWFISVSQYISLVQLYTPFWRRVQREIDTWCFTSIQPRSVMSVKNKL